MSDRPPPGPPAYPPPGYPPPGYTGLGVLAPGVSEWAYAGFWARAGGWFIDAVIVWIVAYLVDIPIAHVHFARLVVHSHATGASASYSGLAIVAEIVIVLCYGALFCGSARGQTPGMMVVGVRAVDRDTGGRIGFWRALGRGAFEYVTVLIFFVPWVLDMLFPLWDRRHQTLHDKVSRTVVVKASMVPPPVRV